MHVYNMGYFCSRLFTTALRAGATNREDEKSWRAFGTHGGLRRLCRTENAAPVALRMIDEAVAGWYTMSFGGLAPRSAPPSGRGVAQTIRLAEQIRRLFVSVPAAYSAA
jgi:hypothetical protein